MDTELGILRRAAAGDRSPEKLRAYTHALFRSGRGLFLSLGDTIAPKDGSIRICYEYAEPARPTDPYDNGSCTDRFVALLDLEHYLERGGRIIDLGKLAAFDSVAKPRWMPMPGTRAPDGYDHLRGFWLEGYRGGLKRVRLLVPGETCPHCHGSRQVRDPSIVMLGGGTGPAVLCYTCGGEGTINPLAV